MFIEERHQAILDTIARNGSITTGEIQEKYGVSYDSAKRDLRILEEKELLKRTHGGAIPLRKIGWDGDCSDLTSQERVGENIKENYLAIAKRAVSLIEEKDVIWLPGASIGYLMAKNMPPELHCTAATNSITIADALRGHENITVLLTGGEVQKNGCSYDAFTTHMIRRLHFDKCFMTSACISPSFGLSIQRTRNLELTKAVLDGSQSVIGLYPTEKIGHDSIVSICPADTLDILVTDWNASEEDLRGFDELGIQIEIVEQE